MTCPDHGSHQPDCVGCLGHWDRAAAQRVLDKYLIYGIAKATIRGALAEVDALTVARNEDRTEWMTTYGAMRAELEALRCLELGPYFDRELSPDRRAAFERHLATCKKCEGELHSITQLDAHTDGLRDVYARRDAVVAAAVAWVRGGGTLAALAAAVNAMEDS